MNDTEWAIAMSDQDTAPDYFLDAIRNARELGEEGFSTEVMGTATQMLLDSQALNPMVNALLLGVQVFGAMTVQLGNGPVKITFEVSDAPSE